MIFKNLTATDLDYDGRGICYFENKTFFIKNLLIGEIADCEIEKIKNNLYFGIAINDTIKNKSINRINNDYNDITNLSHLNIKSQLSFQTNLTEKTFNKFKLSYPKIENIIYNNVSFGYRNKITYHAKNNPYLTLGNYLNDSNNFKILNNITVPNTINKLVNNINDYYKVNKLSSKDIIKITFKINLKDEILIIIYSNKLILNEKLISFLKKLNYNINGIIISNLIESNYNLYYGTNYLNFSIENINYHISHNSFFQVNTSMIKLIYDLIKNNVDDNEVVIDAFAGCASISSYIHKKIKKAYAFEINKNSINDAKNIFNINNINNIEIKKINLSNNYKIDNLKANTIILDPPRNGLNIKFIDNIINSKINKIIYLSCNLKTLSRDLKLLEQNYKIEKVYPLKNFIQTSNCETLTILKINKGE